MLNLPEALLLFGLHDDKGSIHAAAFAAMDHGLRGAVLAELRLKGQLQTRRDGATRWAPDRTRPRHPILARCSRALDAAPSPGPVDAWLDTLREQVPALRHELLDHLVDRGVLTAQEHTTPVLADQIRHPLADSSAEASLVQQLNDALGRGEQISPRMGRLVALTVACHLERVVFGVAVRDDARARCQWVSERDAICGAVVRAVALAEGVEL